MINVIDSCLFCMSPEVSMCSLDEMVWVIMVETNARLNSRSYACGENVGST